MVVSFSAAAQSASAGTSAPSSLLRAETLAERYQDLMGSRQNAEIVIKALREGAEFLLGSDESATIYHPPAVKMSDANIENALALTQAALKARGVDKPKPDQVGTMLMDVVHMRAEGKRWTEVADALGFKTAK